MSQRANFHIKALVLLIVVQTSFSITLESVYTRLLQKQRNAEDTFAFQFVKPIGTVAGEYIWPRSYSASAELIFDENGAAFPVRERPTSLSRILRPLQTSRLRNEVDAWPYRLRR
ncbi:unnamed protein product [Auanema sp. JU1783]|nr:unnamed protein product [Auanema sp. JU1783]